MRVCLAGADNKSTIELLTGMKMPNVLMSYYYLKKRKDKGREILEKAK